MKKIFSALAFIIIGIIGNAQVPYDSLFNSQSKFKFVFLESGKQNEIIKYITDTSGWIRPEDIKQDDVYGNNEILLKCRYEGVEYENPMIALNGYSESFELYRDSVLIYSSGKYLNSNLVNPFYDAHFIPLLKPLNGCTFVLRIHYRSYLDLAGFNIAVVGDASNIANMVVAENRKNQQAELLGFIIGIFMLIAGFFALAAFFIRWKNKDWLLFWFFLFASAQGYVFIIEYAYMIIDIPPIVFVVSIIIVNNLVPIGILGIVRRITNFTWNIPVKLMMFLHLLYALLNIIFIRYTFVEIIYWGLIVIDIILFFGVLFKSGIYKNPDFRFPVIALCILMVLVILDMFAVFNVFYIADDLSSYGMLILVISFAYYIERTHYKTNMQNKQYELESQQTKIRLLALENEGIIAQYEALKNQVDPHFLFNSLNTLSSLIRLDDNKALKFIEEFADIYRYVLDANGKTVVKLSEELNFVKSYIYLQKLRYGDNLIVEEQIDNYSFGKDVVPLSIQILVENAIKHNEISALYALNISIKTDGDFIMVTNTLKELNFKPVSNGIGLKNLKERYSLLTNEETEFSVVGTQFIAKIPLLIMED